ncbi:MAG: ComEC/Rec2 family competence protein [Candidatus Omnitrophota bacterium]
MLKRPLILICLAFIFGIFASSIVQLNFLCSYGCLVFFYLAAVLAARKKVLFFVFLSLSCFYLGYSHYPDQHTLPQNHVSNFTPYKGEFVQVSGAVFSEVARKKKYQCFNIKISKLIKDNQIYLVQGNVQVKLFREVVVEYGQELVLSGKLYKPYKSLNSKFDSKQYLAHKGIYSILSVGKNGKVKYTGRNLGNPLKRMMLSLRQKQAQLIDRHLSPNAAGIMKAMLLGERSNAPQFFNQALQRTGTVHILAVSGLHTGIIIFIVLILLKIIKVPYRLRYCLAILFIFFYCILTGGRISVIRSTIMAVVFLASFIIDRDYDAYSALALSALIILWFIPGQAFEIGFQLSFASVLAIILFYNQAASWFPNLNIKPWQKNLLSGLGVSLCAWTGTLGLVAYYFSIISPISVLANLFIVPLLSLVIASGLLFISLGALIPGLSPVLALNCEFFISLIYRIANFLASLPGAYFEFSPIQLIYVFLYYLVLIAVFSAKEINGLVKKLF